MNATLNPPPPPGRKPEPSLGPDEEGELPQDPPSTHDGKPGAWVSEDTDKAAAG
jgi:hypothetical protein